MKFFGSIQHNRTFEYALGSLPFHGVGKLHVLLSGKNLCLYHEELLTKKTFAGL